MSAARLTDVCRRIAGPDVEDRGRAMQELLLWARKDAAVRPAARDVFRQALPTALDAWTATSVARGLALTADPAEARAAWLTLLARPDPTLVARIALAVGDDPAFIPTLLDMLAAGPHPVVRRCVLRTLGRFRDPVALPALLDALADPAARSDAIQALSDLGDVRAIPAIEPFRQDQAESGQTDDRGYPLQVGDLASDAVRQLEADHRRRLAGAAEPPLVPMLPPELEPAPLAYARPPRRVWFHVEPFVPLAAAVLGVPWFAVVLFVHLVRTGKVSDPNVGRQQDLVIMIPAVVGLLLGAITVARRRVRGGVQVVFFVLGMLGCVLFVALFGHELIAG